MKATYTLGRTERMKSRKQIERLFREGRPFTLSAFKVFYVLDRVTDTAGVVPLQAGVSVSTRNFKKAVHRNRIKRLLRESIRLQKIPLQEQLLEEKQVLHFFVIFTGRQLPEFSFVKEKTAAILQKLSAIANENPQIPS